MNRLRKRYCLIHSCVNTGPNGKDEPLFGLPMDISLRDQWVRSIRNYGSAVSALNYNFRICRLHFDSTDVTINLQNGELTACLKNDAVPKYFDSNPDPLDTGNNITIKTEFESIVMHSHPQNKSFSEKSNCMKCIQTDIEVQKMRVKITQLENRLKEKTAETASLQKIISRLKSTQSNNAPKIEPCTVCQEKLTEVEIFSHSCLENGQELRCQYCARSFKATIKLLEHLKIFHDEKQFYDCDHCPRQFEMAELLKIHSQIHPAESKPKFPCEDCDKTFFLQLRLDQHIDLEHSKPIRKPFKCATCDKCFDSGRGLQGHINSAHVIKPKVIKEYPYQCYVCKQRMQFMSELQIHLKENHQKAIEKRTEKCPICAHFFTKSNMNTHLCRSEDKSIDCEYCSESFVSVLKFLDHVKCHPDRKIFKCLDCGRLFPMKIILEYHELNHHKNATKTWICDICSKSFFTERSRRNHVDRHKLEKTHLCDECGKAFQTERNMKIHKLTHSEPTIQCPHCPQRFRLQVGLKRHMDIHRNTKYICNICNAELTSLLGLNAHLKKHNRTEADRRFACTECPLKFFRNHTLRKHLKVVHSTIKQFQCTYCDAAYKHNGDLNKHLRTHLGDDIYRCPKCPKRFRAPIDLQKHSYEHYKEEQEMQEGPSSMDTA